QGRPLQRPRPPRARLQVGGEGRPVAGTAGRGEGPLIRPAFLHHRRASPTSALEAPMKPFTLAALLWGLGGAGALGHWQPQVIQSDADFRGLCAVGPKVAWVRGTKGTFGRTTDGGKSWAVGTVPGADKLDFRDVEAFGEDTAYLLSAGPGEESRVYK